MAALYFQCNGYFRDRKKEKPFDGRRGIFGANVFKNPVSDIHKKINFWLLGIPVTKEFKERMIMLIDFKAVLHVQFPGCCSSIMFSWAPICERAG